MTAVPKIRLNKNDMFTPMKKKDTRYAEILRNTERIAINFSSFFKVSFT